jgi:hypothetical protein
MSSHTGLRFKVICGAGISPVRVFQMGLAKRFEHLPP